jgi:hypothetical protein
MNDDKHRLGAALEAWCVQHNVHFLSARQNLKAADRHWKVVIQGRNHSGEYGSLEGALRGYEAVLGVPPGHPDVLDLERDVGSGGRHTVEFLGLKWSHHTRTAFYTEYQIAPAYMGVALAMRLTLMPGSNDKRILSIQFSTMVRGIDQDSIISERLEPPREALETLLSKADVGYYGNGAAVLWPNLLKAMAADAAESEQ